MKLKINKSIKKPDHISQKTRIKSFLNKKYIAVVLLFSILFFIITAGCSYLTHGIVSRVSASYPGCFYFAETEEKLIALTIDDGPDSTTTREILSVLQHYDTKATFFLISNFVSGNEDLVSRMVEQGHELGHHMTQDKPSIWLSHNDFIINFNQADSILSQFNRIHWFRPGAGWYNEKMIAYLSHIDYNYRCALGSVYPLDALIPSSLFATVFISINIQPGSIVILHDRENRGRRTMKTLEYILPKLKDRGYKFVTLSELYDACSQGI